MAVYSPFRFREKTTRWKTEMIEKPGGDTVWEVASREGEKSERRGGETGRKEK